MRMGGMGLKISAIVLVLFGFAGYGGISWLKQQAQLPETCFVGVEPFDESKGRFKELQRAIDAAKPKDNQCRILEINEGTYIANLIINEKPTLQLRVRFPGQRVIIRAYKPYEPVISVISSDDLIIGSEEKELKPEDSDSRPLGFIIEGGSNGITIQKSKNLTIAQNHIKRSARNGIELIERSSAKILANAITDNGGCGINLDASSTIVVTKEQEQGRNRNRIARKPGEPASKTFCDNVPSEQQELLRIPKIRVAKDPFSDFLCQTPDGRIFSPCIQRAIEAAEDGDKIEVFEGTYQESLNIKPTKDLQAKNLTLRGERRPILEAQGAQHVIEILNWPKTITIEGFIIQNGSSGIRAENKSIAKATITTNNIVIQSNRAGIEILGNVQVNICDPQLFLCSNLIRGNAASGIKAASVEEKGQVLEPTVKINQTLGILENGGGGLLVEGQAEVRIQAHILEVNRNKLAGIILRGSAKLHFTGYGMILISGNRGNGLALEDQALLTTEAFEGTILILGNDDNGIHLRGCGIFAIQKSAILGNGQNGILLEVPSPLPGPCKAKKLEAKIEGNTINNNTLWGIAGFIKVCDPKATMEKKAFLDKVMVSGKGNNIDGNGRGLALRFLPFLREGDPLGRFCPTDWSFLVNK